MRYVASIILLIIGVLVITAPVYMKHNLGSEFGIGISFIIGIPIAIAGIVQIMRCIKADNQKLSK